MIAKHSSAPARATIRSLLPTTAVALGSIVASCAGEVASRDQCLAMVSEALRCELADTRNSLWGVVELAPDSGPACVEFRFRSEEGRSVLETSLDGTVYWWNFYTRDSGTWTITGPYSEHMSGTMMALLVPIHCTETELWMVDSSSHVWVWFATAGDCQSGLGSHQPPPPLGRVHISSERSR